jgi:predicted O-linked N-acetylglucosamine transferase (SPINDLY family)
MTPGRSAPPESPPDAAALTARADACLTAGDFAAAAAIYQRLAGDTPDDAALHRKLGRALDAAGQADEALARYRRAVALDPGDARAQDELGRLLGRRGDMAGAEAHLRAAVACDPNLAAARAALGDLLCRQRRWTEGIPELRAALALDPTNWAIYLRLGGALAAEGPLRLDEATACFRRVIALKPDQAAAHLQLGRAFWAKGDAAPAIALVERAARLDPNLAAAPSALGAMLHSLGRTDEAIASLRAAVALDPGNATAAFQLGACLCRSGSAGSPEGLAHLAQAVSLAPQLRDAHLELAATLGESGRRADALAAYGAALAQFPDDPALRLGAAMAELPIVAADAADIDRGRARYAAALDDLAGFLAGRRGGGDRAAARQDAEAVGSAQPFFLAYQGRNDRDLQARYGAIVAAVMAAAYPQWAQRPNVPPPAPGEAIRVAIVCGQFFAHSVLKIPIWGWASLFDRRRFRFYGYHTGRRSDGETQRVKGLFDRFVQGPMPVEAWCELIRGDAPHVVIFPEIGMDPVTPQLAGLRLAPVQCASWGHPATSGFPTIDYFLSSELMEPEGAAAHYTERLVRLPGLGIAYVPPRIERARPRRAALGLRHGAALFWCGQDLPKFQPQFDAVFPRIAQRLADAQFLFVASPRGDAVTDAFRRRLSRAFAAAGADAARHVVILPRLATAEFVGAAGLCDLALDSIGWSGCNSALECLAADLPIVTWPGPMMRGRHCLAILHLLSVEETIAQSLDDYVDLAVGLAGDPARRAAIRKRMAANRPGLYADATPVRALEAWLAGVVRDAR